jgi:hypothetical protein
MLLDWALRLKKKETKVKVTTVKKEKKFQEKKYTEYMSIRTRLINVNQNESTVLLRLLNDL